jgi:hypothetical protein
MHLLSLNEKHGDIRVKLSSGPSSSNDVKQDDHDGDDQQNMDETAHGMGGDQTQDPKDDQNNGDGPQHVNSP